MSLRLPAVRVSLSVCRVTGQGAGVRRPQIRTWLTDTAPFEVFTRRMSFIHERCTLHTPGSTLLTDETLHCSQLRVLWSWGGQTAIWATAWGYSLPVWSCCLVPDYCGCFLFLSFEYRVRCVKVRLSNFGYSQSLSKGFKNTNSEQLLYLPCRYKKKNLLMS